MASDDNEPKKSDRIHTLADLNRSSDGDSLNSPQQHHAGGDRSGYDADDIYNQAAQMAADQKRSMDMPSSPSTSRSFTGTARTLSGEILPAAPQQPEPEQEFVVWNDGFTLNNGPFRRLDDPENASFLEVLAERDARLDDLVEHSIKKAEVPEELMPDYGVSGLVIVLERMFKNYSGEGRTLGSDTPASSAPPPALSLVIDGTAASSSEPAVQPPSPAFSLVIDETKPTTSIQIRLADGTRMIAQFNHHHTINDIRGYIDSSMPGGSRNYQLQGAGFPPKQLNDPNQTIEEADIANSVVFQKL